MPRNFTCSGGYTDYTTQQDKFQYIDARGRHVTEIVTEEFFDNIDSHILREGCELFHCLFSEILFGFPSSITKEQSQSIRNTL